MLPSGYDVQVANAGMTGETLRGMLVRRRHRIQERDDVPLCGRVRSQDHGQGHRIALVRHGRRATPAFDIGFSDLAHLGRG